MYYSIDQCPYSGTIEDRILAANQWESNDGLVQIHREQSPLYGHSLLYRNGEYNFSFATQFALTQRSLQDQTPDKTTAYFYTAHSASPLAHTLLSYFNNQATEPESLILSIGKRTSPLKRLRRFIEDNEVVNAVVVDQYVRTGGTLDRAAKLLVKSGVVADNIHPIAARLYDQLWCEGAQARNSDFARVDPTQSELASSFHRAGQLLAAQTMNCK